MIETLKNLPFFTQVSNFLYMVNDAIVHYQDTSWCWPWIHIFKKLFYVGNKG